MRIISGYLKGKKVLQPKNKHTRPLKDLTKESIFNILKHSNLIELDFNNSKVLDLFSGVGSFGLECISRGVKHVTFIENYEEAVSVLKKNIINLNCEKKTKILIKDIFNIKNINEIIKKKFEIIFLDPPYKENKLKNLLDQIHDLELINKNGIIIIHRHKKENQILSNNFKVLKVKTYGVSKIIIRTFF